MSKEVPPICRHMQVKRAEENGEDEPSHQNVERLCIFMTRSNIPIQLQSVLTSYFMATVIITRGTLKIKQIVFYTENYTVLLTEK